ncbi:hypothetical protein TTHERM_00140960 (macronuclear) [Tetrahymena thermophila SB210]|uniref:Uncharacterized protein n=1 Tax=Tetrahymena thermophila (strain SB210) TaxID=312017 RepID=I7M0R3_TETTS|nr:hypothetical protein TTHERM_00140960 [Tetrahymena thermophila SB210]EAR90788.2 hypothetical protein TTHERM_00140960 [Tetrahymena thermophila SB210]|eukprot:XP_001011033.2 hypothetical protein TTHERM_00140960 [Tetrahymena thermophila SB210]
MSNISANPNNATPTQALTSPQTRGFTKRNTINLPNVKGNSKQLSIRPESPRTKEAMLELGIDISEFTLKNLEDFGRDGCSQDIQKIRYEHYLDRLQQDVKDIQEKRAQIIKLNRIRMMNLPPELINQNDYGNVRRSIIGVPNQQPITDSNQRKSTINLGQQQNVNPFNMSKSMSESRMNPRQMKSLYNRTVGYLKSSHLSPSTLPGEEVIGLEEAEGSVLEYQLMGEIDKYNRLKEQKQKEAKILYEEDIERLKTIERMREKELRLLEQTLKQKKEKELKKQQQKAKAEEKLQKVKEQEQKYNQMKREEREKIKKKLEIIKLRQQRESEERERLKKDQDDKAREKRQKMEQIRIQNKEDLVKQCDQQFELIKQQLTQAQEQQKLMQQSRINKLRDKLESEQYKIQQCVDLRVSNEKMQVSRLVQKLIEKEEHYKSLQESEIKSEMEKKKLLKMKAEMTQNAKQKVKNEQNSKISELKQKFEKIEENLEKKRREEQERIKLKQELRQLKEQDKQENYERQKRRDDYRLQKLMEKEKAHSDKIAYIKEQQEIMKKAKYEIAQQTKQETERIFDCVKKVTDTLFPNIEHNSKTTLYNIPSENKEKGISLLKSIFRNDQLDMSIFEPPQKEEVQSKKQQ